MLFRPRRSWLRGFCLAGSLPALPGAAFVFLDRLFNLRYMCSPSPSASVGSFFALPAQPKWLLLGLVSKAKVARSRRS